MTHLIHRPWIAVWRDEDRARADAARDAARVVEAMLEEESVRRAIEEWHRNAAEIEARMGGES